jgi:hypothetical protein
MAMAIVPASPPDSSQKPRRKRISEPITEEQLEQEILERKQRLKELRALAKEQAIAELGSLAYQHGLHLLPRTEVDRVFGGLRKTPHE